MKIACEIIVHEILPTLRAAIAKELITTHNLNQGEVARLLDVSQPAVSQYLRQIRGKGGVVNDNAVNNAIKELSSKLNSNQISADDLGAKMCDISKMMLEKGLVHAENPGQCNMCK